MNTNILITPSGKRVTLVELFREELKKQIIRSSSRNISFHASELKSEQKNQ
jgi:hypothetical protein